MTDILGEICRWKAEHVRAQKAAVPIANLEAQAAAQSPPRGFAGALRQALDAGRYGLICEIKKASPSKGLIRADFDPPTLAEAYERGGASCLSVLTDTPYFQGQDTDLVAARAACTLPCLRKDFMIDSYQIVEARALGADAVLLIMAALSDEQAYELEDTARAFGLDVLIEVHDAEELERAHQLRSPLIGVNNRNLKTMDVSLQTTLDLAPDIAAGRIAVAESGLSRPADLDHCSHAGARCFLIGETFMRCTDVAAAVASFTHPGTDLEGQA